MRKEPSRKSTSGRYINEGASEAALESGERGGTVPLTDGTLVLAFRWAIRQCDPFSQSVQTFQEERRSRPRLIDTVRLTPSLFGLAGNFSGRSIPSSTSTSM